MSEIKSALELALERTANVVGDKSKIEAHDAKQLGMRLAGKLMDDPDSDVKAELAKVEKEKRSSVNEGFFQILISHITLPGQESDLRRLSTVRFGLELVIRDKRSVGNLIEQIEQLLQQYIDAKNQLVESLRQQFEPRMRQREQELSKQVGSPVKLDPASDPEFAKILAENMRQLQDQYSQVVEQAREQFSELLRSQR